MKITNRLIKIGKRTLMPEYMTQTTCVHMNVDYGNRNLPSAYWEHKYAISALAEDMRESSILRISNIKLAKKLALIFNAYFKAHNLDTYHWYDVPKEEKIKFRNYISYKLEELGIRHLTNWQYSLSSEDRDILIKSRLYAEEHNIGTIGE